MKLRFCFVVGVFLMLLTFSACGEKTKELILTEFQSEVTVTDIKTENKITGIFKFKDPSDMSFTAHIPDEIEGLVLSFDGSAVTASVGEVSLPMEKVSPSGDMFSPLFESMALLSASQSVINEKGMNTLNLMGEKGEYKAEFSSDGMKVVSVKNEEVFCEFG